LSKQPRWYLPAGALPLRLSLQPRWYDYT